MTPEYTVGLLGLAASLCAIPALIWAWRRRQLRTDDQTMYEAITDDEPDFTNTSVLVSRRTRSWFALVFLALFALIGWMVIQTVRVASRAEPVPSITHSP